MQETFLDWQQLHQSKKVSFISQCEMTPTEI